MVNFLKKVIPKEDAWVVNWEFSDNQSHNRAQILGLTPKQAFVSLVARVKDLPYISAPITSKKVSVQ